MQYSWHRSSGGTSTSEATLSERLYSATCIMKIGQGFRRPGETALHLWRSVPHDHCQSVQQGCASELKHPLDCTSPGGHLASVTLAAIHPDKNALSRQQRVRTGCDKADDDSLCQLRKPHGVCSTCMWFLESV